MVDNSNALHTGNIIHDTVFVYTTRILLINRLVLMPLHKCLTII